MNKSWDKKLKDMESDISDMTDKLKDLKSRYSGVRKLINGKNINLIEGKKQNRLRINYRGKGIWYHIPNHVDIEKRSVQITNQFIDEILSGRR